MGSKIKIITNCNSFAMTIKKKDEDRDVIETGFYISNVLQKINKVVCNCMECIFSEAKMGKS